jgi:hypothetical protein
VIESVRGPGWIERREEETRRFALVALLVLGAASLAVAGWSLAEGGIGWDSRLDTIAALAVRSVDTSWPLAQAYEAVPHTSEFYGVLVQQFADLLHRVTTGATEPLEPDAPVTYRYQGTVTLLLSLASVSALGAAIAVAFRSTVAGAFAWSLTLATPLWLGMSHVDFKDVPFAAGITLVTAGLVLAFAVRRPFRAAVVGVVLAGAGGAIALGTRPGSLLLVLALAGTTAAVVLVWGIGRRRMATSLPVVAASLSAVACAFGFSWATNPIARIAITRWLEDAIDVARNYPLGDPGRTIRAAGHDLRADDLPWWYVPAWLGAQLPLLTLVAVVAGIVAVVVVLVARPRLDADTAIPLVPIGLQAIGLPLAVVVSGATLYDGIRHLLFMLPALLALPAIAFALLERRAVLGTRIRVGLPLAAVVVVAVSLFSSIRWAPYSYAFVNAVAGRDKDARSWELDYWGVSAREGMRRLREAGLSSLHAAPTAQVGIPWGAFNGPLTPGDDSGLYVFLRWTRAADYGCEVIFTIERAGHVLGEGARCPGGGEG